MIHRATYKNGLMLLVALAGLLLPLSVRADQVIDSLEKQVKSAKTDKDKAYYYDALAREYLNTDPQKGLDLAQKGLKYSIRGKIIKYQVDGYNTKGMLFRIMGQYDSSLFYHHKALSLVEKNKLKGIHLESTYSCLNLAYTEQGNYPAGLDYGFKFLRLIEKGENKLRTAMAYNNIANTYFGIDDFDKAIMYYKKALVIAQSIQHAYGISLLTSNIGSVYYKQGALDSALVYFRRALVQDAELNNVAGMGINYSNIASYFDRNSKYDSSLFYYTKALEVYQQLNMQANVSGAYYNLATVFLYNKQYQKSVDYALKSLTIANEIGSLPHQESAHLALKNAYAGLGNMNKAYFHFEKYIEVRDSLKADESKKRLYRTEIDYEYDMKKYADSLDRQKFNELNTQKLKAEEDRSAWRQMMAYVAGGAFLVMLLLSVFIYKGYRDKNNANKVITEQKRQVEHQKLEIEQKNIEILDSINYAKRIQEAILPSRKLVKEYFEESFVYYKPKDIVAGDFYWMERVENKIVFAAADCTGHGVPGAMVSVVCHNALNRSLREFNISDPGKILDKTRELVIEHFSKSEEQVKDGMDIALCTLEEAGSGFFLEYAGANNPLWILRKGSEVIEEIRPDKQPIGTYSSYQPFVTHKVSLSKGDAIYIFTDGFSDQFGGDKGKKLKASNFKLLLEGIAKLNMAEQRAKIDFAYETWKGNLEQIDDVCVLGVRV